MRINKGKEEGEELRKCVVFEFFHREAGIGMGRPQFGCEAEAVKELFMQEGGFEVLLYEEKEGVADYGMDTQKLIYMVLSKK